MSDHAVFLVHGLWGNKFHFWYVEERLRQACPALKIHACGGNEGNKTYDGIDIGAERVFVEIQETLVKWKEEGNKITKVSIVGYSLGGLIARYVVGLLYSRGAFEEITPVNFTTFATPHLGIRHINPGLFHTLANFLGPKLLSASGRQMFLADGGSRPLLLRIADKDSIFIRGLALFKTRTAYANIINDKSVPYHTAAISQYDPYVDMTRINILYTPSYSPIIVHPTRSTIPLAKPKDPVLTSTMRRLLRTLMLTLLIPLWTTFFIIANLYQSFFSARRIRHHRLHTPQNEWDTAEETGFSSAVQETFEDVIDNASLYSPVEDGDETFESLAEDIPLLYEKGHANGPANGYESEKAVSHKRDEYRLPLTDMQIAMLRGLRSLPWETFGVHIHQTTHSHAAIIRRMKWKKNLVEGQVVIRHWLEGRFQA